MSPSDGSLRATQAAFLDRVMRTGGVDPGPAVLDVPEDRLAVYRDMVLGGYKMMLTFVYTESLRLLDHELAITPATDGAADRAAMINRMIATSPATTHSTREISDRFAGFFPVAYADLVARRPEILDLMAIERAELRAHYHEDDPGRGATPDDVARIRALSVDEFLATAVLRAPSATFLRLDHPAATLQDEIRERRFPASPAKARQCVAVSRDPVSLGPVVTAHEEPGASALDILAAGEVATLESVAERWISSLPPEVAARGEEDLFRAFGDTVLRGLREGFLRIAE